jgi:drug/metabolite transporter (DMT)-like permease
VTDRLPLIVRKSNVKGAAWMIAAAITFTINAACVKQLANLGVDSFQIVFVRSIVGLIVLLPVVKLSRVPLLTRNLTLQILQAFVGTVALASHFYAWGKLPIADVTSLLFTQALFVLVLAVPLLGVTAHLKRWIATLCGFGGALLIVRPGFAGFQIATGLALFAGFCLALQLVLISKLPPDEKDLTMLIYLSAISSLVTCPFGASVWSDPSSAQWLLLVTCGILGIANQACIIRAFRTGDAIYVAPFDYSKLIIAIVAGFFIFGEIPSAWTILGAGLIIVSTLAASLQ